MKCLRQYKILLLGIISFILFFCLQIFLLPNHINLLSGVENKVDFLNVFKISSSNESIQTSLSSQKPLEQNITISSDKLVDDNLTFSLLGFPVKTATVSVLPNTKLVPVGDTIGVNIDTKGVLVLGTGYITNSIGKNISPCLDKVETGDIILSANGKQLSNKEELDEITGESDVVNLEIERDGKIIYQDVETTIDVMDGKKKIGVWIRDSTQGIGTMTYFNPANNKFGALGHGIIDVDTNELMYVKKGVALESEVISVNKGEKGTPGELVGEIFKDEEIGNIEINTDYGIYGFISEDYEKNVSHEAMEIGLKDTIVTGPAKIYSNVNGTDIKAYDIYIEEVRERDTDGKGMVIKITDEELLNETNGIVQGMSGSPIIQNNKLIGAVTHVFIQNPSKGYGIFIETMLENDKKI